MLPVRWSNILFRAGLNLYCNSKSLLKVHFYLIPGLESLFLIWLQPTYSLLPLLVVIVPYTCQAKVINYLQDHFIDPVKFIHSIHAFEIAFPNAMKLCYVWELLHARLVSSQGLLFPRFSQTRQGFSLHLPSYMLALSINSIAWKYITRYFSNANTTNLVYIP